jgi:spore germination cell wall hydrolase CwlJ-like protein
VPYDSAWIAAYRIAQEIVSGRFKPVTTATHYHRFDVSPRWARGMDVCEQAGRHVFLKERV